MSTLLLSLLVMPGGHDCFVYICRPVLLSLVACSVIQSSSRVGTRSEHKSSNVGSNFSPPFCTSFANQETAVLEHKHPGCQSIVALGCLADGALCVLQLGPKRARVWAIFPNPFPLISLPRAIAFLNIDGPTVDFCIVPSNWILGVSFFALYSPTAHHQHGPIQP